jgi:hypothetical protein
VDDVECTVIDVSVWAHAEVSLSVSLQLEDHGAISGSFNEERFSGQERLRSLIDAGCYTLRGADPIPEWDTHPYAHIALWYP